MAGAGTSAGASPSATQAGTGTKSDAALCDTEDERAAADELACAIDAHTRASKLLADADAAAPGAAAAARQAMARSGVLPFARSGRSRGRARARRSGSSSGDDGKCAKPTTRAGTRCAGTPWQAWASSSKRRSGWMDYALLFFQQDIAALSSKFAERLITKVVLRSNGRSSQDHSRGMSRALATAIEQHVRDRDQVNGEYW